MTRLTLLLTSLMLIPATDALAGAGGGSSGYSGGGGSSGGGFSSGGGSSSGGSSEGGGWVILFVVAGFLILLLFGYVTERRARRRRAARERRVVTASAEAAEDDAYFDHESVRKEAAELFCSIQSAWDKRDRDALATMVGEDLMVEWRRRLDDFDTKGWKNHVTVNGSPTVQYMGLTNRDDDGQDRVVVRIEASMRDVVETRTGQVMKKEGESSEVVTCEEYWTLARRDGRWIVVSIEQDDEGEHHLEAPLVTTPWNDEQGLHDEAVLERAREDVPVGATTGELADVDYAGDARRQALDLSLVDERFAPQVLEAGARRAMAAWAEAVDGDDAALKALAGEDAVRALLHGGDASETSRLVVRGPKLEQLTIAGLNSNVEPPRMTMEARVTGRRYVEDRDTLELLSGSRDREVAFTERWTLALDGGTEVPWRLVAAAPVG